MVFAEILCGDEEIVVAGSVEPVADAKPEIARHERVDETQLRERARRRLDGDEFEVRPNVGVRFGVAGDGVLLPFRRRIGGRLEVKELPTRLQILKPLGIEDHSTGRLEGRGRVDDRAVDEFAIVLVHGCWFVGWLVLNADRFAIRKVSTESAWRGLLRPLRGSGCRPRATRRYRAGAFQRGDLELPFLDRRYATARFGRRFVTQVRTRQFPDRARQIALRGS